MRKCTQDTKEQNSKGIASETFYKMKSLPVVTHASETWGYKLLEICFFYKVPLVVHFSVSDVREELNIIFLNVTVKENRRKRCDYLARTSRKRWDMTSNSCK